MQVSRRNKRTGLQPDQTGRLRKTAFACAALLSLLAGNIVLPRTAGAATSITAPFNSSDGEDFFETAFENIESYYIRAVDMGGLTLSGLEALQQTDPRLSVQRNSRNVQLLLNGRAVAVFEAPRDNDADDWAELTVEIIRNAMSVSPSLRARTGEEIYKSVFDNLLTGLDRFTRYAGAETAAEHRAARDGFGGVGIVIEVETTGVRIIEVLPDTPAWQAGLKRGDLILNIDGRPVRGLTQRQVIADLRGPASSSVRLTIQPERATYPRDVAVRRRQIYIPTVTFQAERDIAYIRIEGFNKKTHQSLLEAVKQARHEIRDLRGFILDVRGNPGGLLDQAVESADLFMRKGRILTTQGRHPDSHQPFDASSDDYANGLPIVVIVDGASASAAEILAAALQDSGRAVVIGSTSYGKGSVQTVIDLPNSGELTLTWARLHAPSGYSFHELGVIPTVCTAHNDMATSEMITASASIMSNLRTAKMATRNSTHVDKVLIERVRETCPWERDNAERDVEIALELLHNPHLFNRALQLMRPAVANTGAWQN